MAKEKKTIDKIKEGFGKIVTNYPEFKLTPEQEDYNCIRFANIEITSTCSTLEQIEEVLNRVLLKHQSFLEEWRKFKTYFSGGFG